MTWAAVLAAGIGCYLLKLTGLSVPPAVLARPTMARIAGLMPVALLGALVAVQALSAGAAIVVDARLAGLAFAVGALLLRAPFLVVVVGAAVVAAAIRLLA